MGTICHSERSVTNDQPTTHSKTKIPDKLILLKKSSGIGVIFPYFLSLFIAVLLTSLWIMEDVKANCHALLQLSKRFHRNNRDVQKAGGWTWDIPNWKLYQRLWCRTEYTACNCFMYFISFTENAYLTILAHNGNQRAVNRKDELREGRIFTNILGRIFATEQRTDLTSSLFAVKYTKIARRS